MGRVAKDQGPIGGELTSATPERVPVPGLPMRAVLGLPSLRSAEVLAGSEHLDASVLRPRMVRTGQDLADQDLRGELVVLAAGAWDSADVGRLLSLAASGGAAGVVVDAAIARVGAQLADRGDRFGLSLVALADGTSTDQVAQEVYAAMLERQAAILDREDQVHRTLVQIVLAGGSTTDLCEHLVSFFDGAAMVTTSDGRVLTAAGAPPELEHALALDCFDRTGRFIVEQEPVGILRPGQQPTRRAMVRIVAGSSDHGRLVAFCSHRDLHGDDVHLLERAATVAALAITKEQAVSAVESKYRAEFLRDALAGRAGSAEQAVDHAESLGWDIARAMVVVVAETDEDDESSDRPRAQIRVLQERFARAWTRAMEVRDPRAPVMGFSQEVVAVLGVEPDASPEAVMRQVGDVVRVVSGDGGGGRRSFSTGVSRSIMSPEELPQAYDEALKALSVGRQMHGDAALTHFDRLGVYRLLALVPDSGDLHRFVEESLGELADDDSPGSRDLRQTLAVLLDTNCNVAETARLLFFHYNTLRYRIVKLERMLGPFMSDPQLRFTLALALKVHQMRGI